MKNGGDSPKRRLISFSNPGRGRRVLEETQIEKPNKENGEG
jgi:hypothetical protein